MTIKQGSSRAPGSSNPHVEFKDATGQRTDAFGNPVTRKSPDNRDKLRLDMINSMKEIFDENANPLLLKALRKYFPGIYFALILNWISEQAEDIYWVLIDLQSYSNYRNSKIKR